MKLFAPLDLYRGFGVGLLTVADGAGRIYHRASVSGEFDFLIGGALGVHIVRVGEVETRFRLHAETKIEDEGGRFGELLTMLHYTVLSETGEDNSVLWNGKIYRFFIRWLRDHVHVLKGMKYFASDLKSAIELYRDSQREDGMIWDNVYPRTEDPNYWEVRFAEGGYYRAFDDKRFEFKRIPVENDVEYLFVEGIYSTWKATGDDDWMRSCLDAARRALEYSVTSEVRFSQTLGLLKRGYTIDTWDFQVEGDRIEGDIMRIRPGETRFGAMFGDTTGYIAACRQLAEMLDRSGLEGADAYRLRADGLERRLEEVSWRGTHFQHHVPEDPSVHRDLGVDETAQISLSNAYSLNRGIGKEKAQSIVHSYRMLKEELPEGSPGEWYTIYPPFERGFGGFSDRWQYMNASVTPIVAGELAHGAFENGFETYGADILDRLIDLGRRHGNRFHCSYTGAHPSPPVRQFRCLEMVGQVDVHSSRGWPLKNGNDLRELPKGEHTFAGVPFSLGDLAVGLGEIYLNTCEFPVHAFARSLYLFHTLTGPSDIAGTLIWRYEDGSEVRQYVQRGRDVLGFWMPELPRVHGAPRLAIGWKGANEVLPYVGVSVAGFDNPHPEREVRSIRLVASAEPASWFVMGATVSDSPTYFPVSPISFGIPDGWGASAVIYALIEGLAGVVDADVAFRRVRLSPRWSAASVSSVSVSVVYPASSGYVAYRYLADEGGLEMTVTGSGDEVACAVLMPSGWPVASVTVDGADVGWSVAEGYLCFDLSLPGPVVVRAKWESL